ncbi:MAG TPA: hypothetical protein PLH88_11240 [Spirochaetota bacterium]|nr:hypothetical protein [Spirochaetota bacterium]HRS63474.1 hypothetical protein [Spirochaetota bacterium]HRU66077.1 hypothetical protein [Spirochaetota bacterium]
MMIRADKVKKELKGKIPAVKIEFGKDDKVIIPVLYDQELIEKIKAISGRNWNSQGKYLQVPYRDGIIAKLQNIFGENLIIEPYFYLIPFQN